MPARELLRFGLRNLTARRTLHVTLAVALTLAVVSLSTLAAYGLVYGAEAVALARAKADPLALRMLAGDDRATAGELTPARLAELEKLVNLRIRRDHPTGGRVRTVSPFRVMTLLWRLQGTEGLTPIIGRTIQLEGAGGEHPLLRSRTLRAGEGFSGPEAEGVILCPSALEKLGLPPDAAPDSAEISINARLNAVPVLGVFAEDLPERVGFVLTEHYEGVLRRKAFDPEIRAVFSGPTHPSWPAPAQFPEDALRLLGREISVESQEQFNGPPVLLLTSESAPAPTLSEWRRTLDRLRQILDEDFSTDGTEQFCELDAAGQSPPPNMADENYDLAEFYFDDPRCLPPAAHVFAEQAFLKGAFDRMIADQVSGVIQRTEASLEMVRVGEWMLASLALCNLSVIQVLRSAQKVSEAGMLRAIGLSGWGLAALTLIEVGSLWFCSTSVGIVSGWMTGYTWSAYRYPLPEEAALGFAFTGDLALYTFLGTGIVSFVSSLLATLPWYFRSPARLLRAD